jgi:hypothetical protein
VIKPLAGAPAEPSAPARARSRSRPAALAVKLQTPTARASCSCRIAERKARSGCRGRARRAPADRSRQVGGQPETIGSLWQPKQEFESGRARGLNLSQYCERSRRSEVPSFPVCPDRILRRRWSRICTRPMRRRHVVVHGLAGGNSSSEGVPPQSRACNSVGARLTIRTPIRVKPIGAVARRWRESGLSWPTSGTTANANCGQSPALGERSKSACSESSLPDQTSVLGLATPHLFEI